MPFHAPGVYAQSHARRAPLLDAGQPPPADKMHVGRSPDHRARLAELTRQIASLRFHWRVPSRYCPTGVAWLDTALGGGLLTAAVHELIAASDSAPAYSLAMRVAAQAAVGGKWIVYIDTTRDLYPPALLALGVPLGRLIVVRSGYGAEAFWAAEQSLRCHAVAAVLLPLRNSDPLSVRRLQLAAETGGGIGLLICAGLSGGATFAASRLRLDCLPGRGVARRVRITVLKQRAAGQSPDPLIVEWPDAADPMSAYAVSVDRSSAPCCRPGG